MACLCLPSSLFLIASDKSGAEFVDVCTSESILSDIVFSELFSQLEKKKHKGNAKNYVFENANCCHV